MSGFEKITALLQKAKGQTQTDQNQATQGSSNSGDYEEKLPKSQICISNWGEVGTNSTATSES